MLSTPQKLDKKVKKHPEEEDASYSTEESR